MQANSLYDATENGSASSDASAQTFRVSYKADMQSAYIRVQQNSPISSGVMVDSVVGSTNGKLTFSATDATLAVSGYTYTVGYDYDAANTVWYSTLSDALAANSAYDATNNNGGTTDTNAQRFVVLYAPMSQAAAVVVDASSPISAGSTAMSANGVTGSAISFAPSASNTTLDSQLAKSGYTYTVKYGSDSATFTTLSSALAAHSFYNANNTTSGVADDTPDKFTVSYKADYQSAVVNVTGTSPIRANSKFASNTGGTSDSISFSITDANLYARGYMYTVTGPDGKVYSNLASALSANPIYDNTNNLGSLNDSAVQSFMVSYRANYQSAYLQMDENAPRSAGAIVGSAAGVTAGNISFNVTDSQLAVPGYQYNIYTAMGSSYATLSSALVAEGRFDSTQNVGSSDQSAQAYFVVYTADQQSAYIQVNAKSPISAGNMVDSQVGETSAALTFVDTDDSDLYVRGYHYTVTGPDGKAYSDLSSAIAANSIYDATDNTGANDASAQAFTVNYVADHQQASLAVTSDSPISMGSVVTTVSGGTAETIPFSYTDSQIAVSGYSYRVMGPDGEWYSTLAEAQSNNTTFDDTSNATDSDAEAQMFTISYSALSQAARVVGADKSPIRAGLTMGSAAGVTSQAISFASTTDATLAQSGYSYVVYMGSNSTTSYSTLSAAMAANSLYNDTNTASGASDADPQIFTVSYVANYQSANLVVGGNTQISSGVAVDSSAGVTSGRVSFGTNDSALAVDGYRYTVKTPDGKTYATLSSALAGTTGLYDNTNNATNSDAAPQTYTIEYVAITQTAEVVVAETQDEYSGQVLESVTGDTGAALGIKLTDATLQSMEMTQGYTYYVTVKHADGSWITDDAGNIVRYATLDEAIAANNTFDAVDTGIKQFILNPVPSYQESTLTVTSDSPISAATAVETTSGVTNSAISYSTTDSTLVVPGYTYQVSVVGPDGTTQPYATLSSALAAQSLYDNTSNGDTQSDQSAQAFQVSYKADYQSANIAFVTDSGATPMSAIAAAGVTSGVYTSTYTAAAGYYFTDDGQPSGTSVAADGRTATFTFNYDNTDNTGASDSAAQSFTLKMAPASQSGNISFSYADAIGSPTVPDDVPLAGVTGDSKTGTITAPEGYYIVSISGDPYNVVYTDETHQEATYSVILDDTPNGNSATDLDSQDMVVTFAPNNQTANIIQTMPDGTSSVFETKNAKTGQSYAYEYTAPAGYYVASGSAAAASGMTTEISNDGKTVNVTGTYDNSKNTDASGTDAQTQDTTITLSKSEQVAMFKINVPTWSTTVTAKLTSVPGYTADNITVPQGFSDSELTKAGYSYTVTGPDGEIYDTMAEALAANPIFDSTNNGSGQDTEAQYFTVTYVAADQSATIKQQYADGAPNTPAFPQSDEELNGKSEQVVKGTFNAPTGYEISNITDAPGIVWTIAADKKSATYTLTYDTVAETDGPTQNTVVTYTPLAQKVVVEFVDEVGRTLTTDTKVTNHTLTGVTNETVNYDDASLQADQKIAGYQLVVQNQADAANLDNDTAVDQKVRYVYRDVQAPTITTTKDELVSSKSGMPATEADFLAAVGFKTTDNQQYGTSVTTTDYETIAAQVAKDGVSRDVTITVKDATGNTTTKTVTLTAVETAPVSQETALKEAQQQLDDLAKDPSASEADVAQAKQALQDAVDQAKQERDAAKTTANDALTSDDTTSVATDPAVADAMQDLRDAIAAGDADTGTSQAITDATNALENAVARAEAKAVDTAPVAQEPDVQAKQDALNNVLNDPTATADQINDATQALRTATETAVDQRSAVDQDAATAITNTQGSNQSDEPSVKAAEQALQDLVDQAKTDNPDALTQDIRDAIKNLQDAIAEAADNQGDARHVAQDALNATAPVSHEQATAEAIQNLQDVLNNSSATTADIQEATEKLTAATAADQATRDATNSDANNAVSAAQSSDQATEPGVLDAIQHLKDVQAQAAADSSDALTDDIKQAIADLAAAQEAAKQNQQAARDAAAQAIADSQPVSNEATVTKARDALNQLLQDPSSSTADIEKATDALTAANTAEQTKRDAINQQADAYETKVANSNQREEPAVQAALDALQELQDEAATDSPDALTADIANALDALRTAVTQAAKDQAEARDNAADALADLAPVSNEPAVQAAKDALDKLLADSTSTADDIKQATQDLLNATSDDKADRTTANTNAQNAMTDAQNSKQADEPAVQDALKHLQDVMDAAANDDANALTADIIDAQKALEQAVADAKNAQEQARKDAAIAIASTNPVSNEPGTAQALNNLEAVLNDPNATQAEITAATKALRDQTATDKQARDAANTNGDAAIKLAQASDQSDEPSVVAAIKNLQDIMTAAATDTNTALTKDITSAIAALQTAEETAQANQEQARTDAQTALGQTAPVSNEAAVADAISNLQKLLDDPKSTAKEIANATTALTTAVADANEKRDAANAAADQAVSDVPSELASEPTVAAAEQALKELQDAAAADQSDALTADIEAATKALQDAAQTADQARDTARDAATDLLTQTAPLSNEAKVASAKDALQKLLDDPTSTTAAIENATATLRDALRADGADRNAANTAGTSLVDLVKGAPAYTDKAVQDAVQKLQDVMAAAAKDSATDLTADIEAATKALQDTFTAANSDIEAARDAANALLGKTAPISHEPAVATAIADLEKVLQDASSSAESIEAATKALQDAMTPAQTARDTANTAGQKLLDATKNTTAAKDKGVQDAMSRLQAVMAAAAKDSATNLTADIEAAMKALQAAVNTADGGRQAAVDAANDLLTKTAPVSHEADIETATAALQTALDAANKARTTANTAGTQAIKTAQASDQSADPAVQAAIKHLQDVMAAAATDSANDLTADIEAAMKALQAAVQQSASERAAAAAAANDLLGKTAPVSHEPAVADAISKLQAVLNDPKATAKDIQAATAALQSALDAANAARTNANKAGHDAVTAAQNTAVAGDAAVQAALAHLQAIMDAAGKDSADDLTADILAAVKALEAAIATAEGKPVPTETPAVPAAVATPVTSSGETAPVVP